MTMVLKDITLDDLHLDELLFHPYPYEQQMVKYITMDGRQMTPSNAEEVLKVKMFGTIKIEGMEKISKKVFDALKQFSHDGPVTCHVFIAAENAPSFPDHTDPDGVLIYVVDGVKNMFVDGKFITLNAGQSVFIPPGTPHRAVNYSASVMMSVGFEKFIVEKL
ncbi:hypothetical protein AVU38_gp066 [Ralstonia phage RSL2]|uniref:Cupin type-2 domain-containing protein n=1 Tax=Ralstonia phage RSL2 TaxID=1585840 RepID=A0A0A8J9D0_9CAUD|nr:hypothetical protein AVU38_gp066 [Ralstonia phage RSL2]BAQ02594.1 hypothetical protein [Ralstonia phage RSL2]